MDVGNHENHCKIKRSSAVCDARTSHIRSRNVTRLTAGSEMALKVIETLVSTCSITDAPFLEAATSFL
jgi:hypothetical protein